MIDKSKIEECVFPLIAFTEKGVLLEKWLKESGANEPKIVLDGASSVMIGEYGN